MITLSNLRTELAGEWTRLACDFAWDGNISNPFKEKTIWFAVRNENADFFSTRVYDPFLMVPYFVAMHYGQDLKICGKVSKKLYRNLTNYGYRILLDYSDELKPIHCEVDGFDQVEQDGHMIGSSISCGIDCFTTLYDRYAQECDPEYRVNSLFFFNSGSYGSFYEEKSYQGYLTRFEQNKKAAEALELPIYQVESNIQFFQEKMGLDRIGTLSAWSCVLCLQNKVKRYYYSSSNSYCESAVHHDQYHNFNLDEFGGAALLPLVQTENIEIIFDGGQYTRTEKTEHIADWNIARKYLNVCFNEAKNDSICPKCLRTMMALESINKLDAFSEVFDLNLYKKMRFYNLCEQIKLYKKDAFCKDNIDFAKAHGMKLPPKWFAHFYANAFDGFKALFKKLFRGEGWEKMKKNFLRA